MEAPVLVRSLVEEGILQLTVNRPHALNALNQEVFEALRDFFVQGYKDYDPLYGLIISGAGDKSFVAGADIQELSSLKEESARELVQRGHKVMDLIEGFHIPVVAAVNGYALGGGLELAMSTHLKIAVPKAQFGLPELKLGLIPGYGGTQRLATYVGRAKAMEMTLTSAFMSADEALTNRLINQIVEPEQLIPSAIALIRKISERGPTAVSLAIQTINAQAHHAMAKEQDAFCHLLLSAEGKEGTTAFLEKRKPNFRKK
ncbi:MAG: enoyl-CoA hydratase-related protein [Bacteroidota bacterium]